MGHGYDIVTSLDESVSALSIIIQLIVSPQLLLMDGSYMHTSMREISRYSAFCTPVGEFGSSTLIGQNCLLAPGNAREPCVSLKFLPHQIADFSSAI